VGFKVNFKTEWHTAYVEDGKLPPPRMSVLAGESLYQARSVLEHLIWALVKANHKKPGTVHTFPILPKPIGTKGLTDAQAFAAHVNKTGKLVGVQRAAITLIEKLQRYNTPHPGDYTLTVLTKMARDDRHRTLPGLFVGGADPSILQSLFLPHRGSEIVAFKTLLRQNQRIVIGQTRLARLKIQPLSRQPKVKVKGEIPTLIAFGDRTGYYALPELAGISADVRNILRLFEKFF